MISEFTEHSKQLLQTKDGIRAVCKMMQYGTVKDRKVIAKAFKGHVPEMVSDNEGYLALLTALSVNDDIRLIQDFVRNLLGFLFLKGLIVGLQWHAGSLLQDCPRWKLSEADIAAAES